MTILDYAILCQSRCQLGHHPELGQILANIQPTKAAQRFIAPTASDETRALFAKAWRELLQLSQK